MKHYMIFLSDCRQPEFTVSSGHCSCFGRFTLLSPLQSADAKSTVPSQHVLPEPEGVCSCCNVQVQVPSASCVNFKSIDVSEMF